MNNETDLIKQVLENLGALATGQTPQIEDTQRVKDNAPLIIDTLRLTEVFYLNDINAIEDGVLIPLAAVVAYGMRHKFSITDPQELATLKDAADTGIDSLKIIARGRPTYAPVDTEFI